MLYLLITFREHVCLVLFGLSKLSSRFSVLRDCQECNDSVGPGSLELKLKVFWAKVVLDTVRIYRKVIFTLPTIFHLAESDHISPPQNWNIKW